MPLGRFADEDDATAQRMVDINLHGVLFGMKAALPRMERRDSGHIVNIASQAGKGGFPGGATYCATKFAVVGSARPFAPSSVETGIEVSCRDAGGGQHRARRRACVETRGVKNDRARGGRRRDRRRAQDAALRRLRAHDQPAASRKVDVSCCRARVARRSRARSRRDKVLAERRPRPARGLRGPRRALRARRSSPSAEAQSAASEGPECREPAGSSATK